MHSSYIVHAQLDHILFVTCSWVVHDFFITCSLLVHNIFTTCSHFVCDLFISCSWLFHNSFTTRSLLVHNLFLWQKNTVGTQKMNAHCKRRNKSSYRKYILFHRKKKLSLYHRKNISCEKVLPVRGNLLLWQEIASCERKCFPVTGFYFALRANFFLWQQDSSCVRKFLPVTGIFFLWQEISSKDRTSSGMKALRGGVIIKQQENFWVFPK